VIYRHQLEDVSTQAWYHANQTCQQPRHTGATPWFQPARHWNRACTSMRYQGHIVTRVLVANRLGEA
jgi:hypothetical protein